MARNQRDRSIMHRWMNSESAPGIVLMVCAGLALALANSPLAGPWHDLFHHAFAWTPIAMLDNAHAWINDGLMAVFFFVVGLEIKREMIAGALSDPVRRRLPVIAAMAGMIVPAGVFLALTSGDAALHPGWAIPAATDIAFAMGILALAGRNVPPSVRLFLLTVAIVDDLGAVAVIAFFYTAGVSWIWLVAAAAVLALMIGFNRFGIRNPWLYAAAAVALWFAVLHSGVHATVAGVLAAFTVPMALDLRGHSALLRMEHALVKPNAFIVVPLFGLANAGVALGAGSLFAPLPLGIAAGLFVGKQAGILAAILGCERLGIAPRPEGTSLAQLWGLALLCGIGFTMSLFIAALAFPAAPLLVEEAKLGILAGSALSALAGAVVLRLAAKTPQN